MITRSQPGVDGPAQLEDKVLAMAAARAAMDQEAAAIRRAGDRLGESFLAAVSIVLQGSGRLVVTGVGKSGLIARKIAATLTSTGLPACFLHPVDAFHGDLGICCAGDTVILLSNSGSTAELLNLMPWLRQRGCSLVAIVGNMDSALARGVDVALDASIPSEADPCGIVPTCSAAVALALGDALACALMAVRRVSPADFGMLHPGGKLGRDLRTTVAEVMHRDAEVARTGRHASLKEVVIEMTRHPLGAAVVLGPGSLLEGLITDGDIRRALERHDEIRTVKAADIMTPRPITIGPEATLREAMILMESRASQLSVLPVTDDRNVCLGLIRVHDLYGGARKVSNSRPA
jgi:arabinose-5-phosphate isomerase